MAAVESALASTQLVPATDTNLAEFEKRRAEYEAKANQQLTGAEARRAQLEGASITLKANASPEGKLFGECADGPGIYSRSRPLLARVG